MKDSKLYSILPRKIDRPHHSHHQGHQGYQVGVELDSFLYPNPCSISKSDMLFFLHTDVFLFFSTLLLDAYLLKKTRCKIPERTVFPPSPSLSSSPPYQHKVHTCMFTPFPSILLTQIRTLKWSFCFHCSKEKEQYQEKQRSKYTSPDDPLLQEKMGLETEIDAKIH